MVVLVTEMPVTTTIFNSGVYKSRVVKVSTSDSD